MVTGLEPSSRELTAPDPRIPSGRMLMNSLPCVPGHGLWVVQQVADQVRSLSGPRGTSIMVTFGLSRDVSPNVAHD